MLPLAILIGFAAYRASRFLARDSLISTLRHRFYRRFPPNEFYRRHVQLAAPMSVPRRRFRRRPRGTWQITALPARDASWLGRLIDCPWCSSVWFAAAITAAVAYLYPTDLPVLVWAASCSVAGLCATLENAATRE